MARRKAGATAADEGGAASTTEALSTQVATLQRSMDLLQSSLQQLVQAAAVQTMMLREVLAAATTEAGVEEPMYVVLGQIFRQLGNQSALLKDLGSSVASLPVAMGAEVAKQMASALDDVG